MNKIPYTKENLERIIPRATSYSDALRLFGRNPIGGTFTTLKKYLTKYNIPTDHFNPWQKGMAKGGVKARPLKEVLVKNSDYNRGRLKRRLLKENMLELKCSACGQEEDWQGGKLPMILDHINGISDDNRLKNLRIICPNCDSISDTYCGRNMASAKAPISQLECIVCKSKFTPKKRNSKRKYCSEQCHTINRGKKFSKSINKRPRTLKLKDCQNSFCDKQATNKYCSAICYQASNKGTVRTETRKVKRPSYDKLMKELEGSNYSKMGRKYGVSDNAIRKWIKAYEKQN